MIFPNLCRIPGFYGCVADVTRQLRSTAFAQQETFANVQARSAVAERRWVAR
jgi:hypothetical protein